MTAGLSDEDLELFIDEDDDSLYCGEDDVAGSDEDAPCGECSLYGEFQCSAHADGYLLACAEDDRRQRMLEALSVIGDLGPAYGGVVGEMAKMAREATQELGGP